MIYKESLLKELKRDKRPIQGCLTYDETIREQMNNYLNYHIKQLYEVYNRMTTDDLTSIENIKVNVQSPRTSLPSTEA